MFESDREAQALEAFLMAREGIRDNPSMVLLWLPDVPSCRVMVLDLGVGAN